MYKYEMGPGTKTVNMRKTRAGWRLTSRKEKRGRHLYRHCAGKEVG